MRLPGYRALEGQVRVAALVEGSALILWLLWRERNSATVSSRLRSEDGQAGGFAAHCRGQPAFGRRPQNYRQAAGR
jgi:hypothetical protein